ncbi:MAG: redoxin domain-containing protein [Acidobacteria bacterium]|nr:redoxin domain-containing protein [Acidobacteriota bacterium]MBK8150940.1 redoxin domain-containing protein [Acidobacteriota bacterium]MBK8810814.1 redoxin domain-containing protein [Acidobacteriota bacterium]
MDEILLLIRIFLFSVLSVAAVGKLLDLEGSKTAVKEFGVPEDLAEGVAYALPIIEIGFAILLLPLFTAWFGAIGTFVLLAVFIGGMIWQIAKGNAPDCHCFGAIHSEPVSWKSLIRNVVFAALAFSLVAQGYYNQGLGVTELTIEMAIQLIFGIAFAALLGLAVFYLKKISEQQTQIMRRIELLEVLSHEGGKEVKREDINAPVDGLPIGAVLPRFELKDLVGRTVTSRELTARGRPMLFFFVSPTCTPCTALLPEIEEWQKELRETVDFVIFSTGEASLNTEKFGGKSFKQILLQNDREVAELFRAEWTPGAIFINYRGVVASQPAVGDAAIRELIGKIKAEEPARLFALADAGDSLIGSDVPEFALKDLNDNDISSADLKGKSTLLMYWSMGCGYCREMMKDLIAWDQEKGKDHPNLVVLSQGKPEDHSELKLSSPILIEEAGKTAEAIGMPGTPSAVMVNEDGKIVSQIAVGASNIWSLVGHVPPPSND